MIVYEDPSTKEQEIDFFALAITLDNSRKEIQNMCMGTKPKACLGTFPREVALKLKTKVEEWIALHFKSGIVVMYGRGSAPERLSPKTAVFLAIYVYDRNAPKVKIIK